jgi:predicted dinucleotide-binding enzyme
MNIVVIGRGNPGGGLAALWRKTGHQVIALGRGGGNASGRHQRVAVPQRGVRVAGRGDQEHHRRRI